MDIGEKILSSEEKTLNTINQNEIIKQRITVTQRDGLQSKNISIIKKKKILKEMLPSVIERMKWKKFGEVSGQERGFIEANIVSNSIEEIKIINRKNDIEKDLGDKLKEKLQTAKLDVYKEYKEKKEREKKEKLDAILKENQRQMPRQNDRRRNNDCTIKVNGFNPNYSAAKLAEIFSKVGDVAKVVMPNKNLAFIRFYQSTHTLDAYNQFNEYALDGCIIHVTLLDNK